MCFMSVLGSARKVRNYELGQGVVLTDPSRCKHHPPSIYIGWVFRVVHLEETRGLCRTDETMKTLSKLSAVSSVWATLKAWNCFTFSSTLVINRLGWPVGVVPDLLLRKLEADDRLELLRAQLADVGRRISRVVGLLGHELEAEVVVLLIRKSNQLLETSCNRRMTNNRLGS